MKNYNNNDTINQLAIEYKTTHSDAAFNQLELLLRPNTSNLIKNWYATYGYQEMQQIGLLALYHAIQGYDSKIGDFTAFYKLAGYRKVIELLRKERKELEHTRSMDESDLPAAEQLDDNSIDYLLDLIQDETNQHIFILRFVENLKLKDIAAITNISISSISKRIKVESARIKKLLEQ